MVYSESIQERCSPPFNFCKIFCPICPVHNELVFGRFLNSVLTVESCTSDVMNEIIAGVRFKKRKQSGI